MTDKQFEVTVKGMVAHLIEFRITTDKSRKRILRALIRAVAQELTRI